MASYDPRKPSAEKNFSLVPPGQEEVDYMSICSLAFGIMGMFMKVDSFLAVQILNTVQQRVFVWQSLLCCIMSLANLKAQDLDFKHVFSSLSIPLMGFVMVGEAT